MTDWYDSFYDFESSDAGNDAGSGSDYGTIGNFGRVFVDGEGDEPSALTDADRLEMARFGVYDPTAFAQTADNPLGYDTSMAGSAGKPADVLGLIKSLTGDAAKFARENPDLMKLLLTLGGGYLGYQSAKELQPSGGGVARPYTSPKTQLTRTIDQGRYGPISRVRFAAQGGIMQAYRNGGQVRPFPMQDGGFVMTKKAVDGAGGPQGLASLVPGARMIRGPGHGTSDSIPAYIQGPSGRTPARVSNGEAYVPPGYDPRKLQATMKRLERKA